MGYSILMLKVIQVGMGGMGNTRSEEHTSELQSLTNLVCRLLLEKKNLDKPQYRRNAESCEPVALVMRNVETRSRRSTPRPPVVHTARRPRYGNQPAHGPRSASHR